MQIKKFLLIIAIFFSAIILSAQQNIKNVIILIPDGTSAAIITLARWYQDNQALAVDGIICGLVKTHSVENKITDSAPSSTAYATGEKSKTGYVGVDSSKAPLWSVLELSKLKGMSTGIVATCQFPH
ncbi:MAG: alkaline phosphatase, partial [Bacteroidota bacterium]